MTENDPLPTATLPGREMPSPSISNNSSYLIIYIYVHDDAKVHIKIHIWHHLGQKTEN